MDIASATGAATATSMAESRLIGDYNSFLLLLTTQLKNQDPLAPIDATQFVSQLSQFASVEQMIVSNQKLDQIISALSFNALMADVGLIGRGVEVAGNTAELWEGQLVFGYTLAKDAAQGTAVIRDESGAIVRVLPIDLRAGEHALVWDGTDSSGTQLSDGRYTVTLGAADADGKVVATQGYVTAMVTRVETTSGGSSLVLSNGMTVASSAVRAVM
jgi:flagellar basal-body rod modification protein FlgD